MRPSLVPIGFVLLDSLALCYDYYADDHLDTINRRYIMGWETLFLGPVSMPPFWVPSLGSLFWDPISKFEYGTLAPIISSSIV
jgi:hypothetical protein